jgi:hypothetical protein
MMSAAKAGVPVARKARADKNFVRTIKSPNIHTRGAFHGEILIRRIGSLLDQRAQT